MKQNLKLLNNCKVHVDVIKLQVNKTAIIFFVYLTLMENQVYVEIEYAGTIQIKINAIALKEICYFNKEENLYKIQKEIDLILKLKNSQISQMKEFNVKQFNNQKAFTQIISQLSQVLLKLQRSMKFIETVFKIFFLTLKTHPKDGQNLKQAYLYHQNFILTKSNKSIFNEQGESMKEAIASLGIFILEKFIFMLKPTEKQYFTMLVLI